MLEKIVKTKDIRNIIDDSDVYITVPANFNDDQRNYTLLAANRAGIKNAELYDEPKAAILSYIHEETDKRPEDIGGGTCDICLQDVWNEDGSFMFNPIGTPNRENIGGIDFDQRIATYLYDKYQTQFNLTENNFSQLLDISQEAKEKLSSEIVFYIEDELGEDESEVYQNSEWKNELQELDDRITAKFGNWKNEVILSIINEIK